MIILVKCQDLVIKFKKKFTMKRFNLKIYSNIIDNENHPYYLSNVFIKSNVSELTVYNENNIYKKQKIINDIFNYVEIEIFDEKNEKIEMTDYFSVSLYIY